MGNDSTSTSWSGYVYCPGASRYGCGYPLNESGIVGVRGSFGVPEVRPTVSGIVQGAATWVGIGGFDPPSGLADLIQAGVVSSPPGASNPNTTYQAWFETLPEPWVVVNLTPDPLISAADTMWADIEFNGTGLLGQQLWNILIVDNSTASRWSGTISCGTLSSCRVSSYASADWIVESPTLGNNSLPGRMPAFSTVRFRGAMYLNASGAWSYLSGHEATLYRVSMVGNPPPVVAVPSQVYGLGTFWDQYLADTADPWMQAAGDSVRGGSVEPGQSLFGNLTINYTAGLPSGPPPGIGVVIELSLPTGPVCTATSGSYSPLPIQSGQHTYPIEVPLCLGTPRDTYSIAVGLWYLPPGVFPGENGSLLLFTATDSSEGYIVVDGPSASLGILPNWLGRIEAGQPARFEASVVGGMAPYWFGWTGLPPGCVANDSPMIDCTPGIAGDFAVRVLVLDAANAESPVATTDFTVVPRPSLTLSIPSGVVTQGTSVVLAVRAAGGLPPYAIVWRGLPPGCEATLAPTVACMPQGTGTFDVRVAATDLGGGIALASGSVSIGPGIAGIPLWVPVALGGAAVVAAVAVWRPLRRLERRD